MKHLIIKNVGPIKEAELEIKKYNFFIGPQSSGKSTIAKVISTCSWVEKEVATTLDEKSISSGEKFRCLVEGFHKMTGYFSSGTTIIYETDSICLRYENYEIKIELKPGINYFRHKICYIPEERNVVTLPELLTYPWGSTNLRSFLFDWYSAREHFDPTNKSRILNLGVSYYFDKEESSNKDRIERLGDQPYKLSLSCASSGLQSVVPLLIMLRYYSKQYFYQYDYRLSHEGSLKGDEMRRALMDKLVLEQLYPGFSETDRPDLIHEAQSRWDAYDPEAVVAWQKYEEKKNQLTVPIATDFIVEEPEQNLFPYTQLQLIESMVQMVGEKDHSLTVTTHSPYILNVLNVLLLRFDKRDDVASINPEDLNVFSVQDGHIYNQVRVNASTGFISVNTQDLSEAMQDMYEEYKALKNR